MSGSRPKLIVTTLGGSLLTTSHMSLTPTSVRKFALLLYLAAQPDRRLSRAGLQELVFADGKAANGRHSLRELLYQLRRAGLVFKADADAVELSSESVSRDYVEFIQAGRLTPEQVAAAENGFLPGYAPVLSESFTEWLDGFRARTISELVRVILREVQRALAANSWVATERAARACLALDPLNEEATLSLAEAVARSGSKAKAVAMLNTFINDVGASSTNLTLPATLLRRRIDEGVSDRVGKGEPPFVGREAEMHALMENFLPTLNGAPRYVIIGGEPGIGKTRLAAEFRTSAQLRGANVLRMVAQSNDTSRPLATFVDLVPMLMQLPGALGCSPATMESLRRLTTHDADFTLPIPSSPQMEALEFAISGAIADLIDAVSSEAPLVLLIEDAHWLDRPSQQVLNALVAPQTKRRLFVVITTREPRKQEKAFVDGDSIRTINLGGLSRPASQHLADWILSGMSDRRSAEITEALVSRSAGNPYFLIELAAANPDQGPKLVVPESLRSLIHSRVVKLDDRAMALLQTCRSFGKHCTVDRLVAALQMPHIDLLGSVSTLCDARLLDHEADEVRLTHPLLAEVLEGEMFEVWRKLVAYRVAGVLQVDADRLRSPALLWDCAEQWRRAGEASKAVDAIRACARHSTELGRPAEALRMLEAALDVSNSAEARELVGRELVLTADSVLDPAVVLRLAESADLSIVHAHDDVEIAILRAQLRQGGEQLQVEDRVFSCLSAKAADVNHRVKIAFALLRHADSHGREDLLRRLQEAFNLRDLDSVDEALRLEYLLVWHCTRNENVESVQVAERLRSVAAELIPTERLRCLRNLGVALWRVGDVRASLEALLEAHGVATALGAARSRFHCEYQMAVLFGETLEPAKSNEWLTRARDSVAANAELADDPEWMFAQMDLALNRGEVVIARRLLQELSRGSTPHSGSSQRFQAAAELWIRVLSGDVRPSDADIAREMLAAGHLFTAGIRETEVAVACMALDALGEAREARASLERYLGRGRTRQVEPYGALRTACSRLDWWPQRNSNDTPL